MPVMTNLQQRVEQSPEQSASFQRNQDKAGQVATSIPLIHVSGKGVPFGRLVQEPPHELPTSAHPEYYSDDTRRAEQLLAFPCSAYFYAGRAIPEFGNVALAFAPECETGRTGSATPFDSGGLMHEKPYIRLKLTPTDDEDTRVAYGKASAIPLL